MLFTSWNFLVYFLPATVGGFYLIPGHLLTLKKLGLILASICFYAYWKAEYVPLLLGSILVNFSVAHAIANYKRAARTFLIAGILFNLLLLGYYKYTNFAIHSFSRLGFIGDNHFDIIVPLAISFFTFTQVSYIVDVYRDRTVHYGFLDYALFVVFFLTSSPGPSSGIGR